MKHTFFLLLCALAFTSAMARDNWFTTRGEKLVSLAQWYAQPQRAAMLRKYEKYLLLNIANEWGDHQVTSEHWLQSYIEAVGLMRQAGYHTTLVVDAPGWGQNITPFLENGQQLIDADPLHNILLPVQVIAGKGGITRTARMARVFKK